MRKRVSTPPPEPIPVNMMLQDLASARAVLAQLPAAGRPYGPLIEAIRGWGAAVPTAKALRQQCGATPAQLKRWLTALYHDFLTAIATRTGLLHFTQAEHCFVVSGPRGFLSFRCRVPVTPRIGENLDLGFVRGAVGTSNFYVKSCASEYENGQITTYVYLTAEAPDPYFEHLLERATFERKISNEEEAMSRDELRAYLRRLYQQG